MFDFINNETPKPSQDVIFASKAKSEVDSLGFIMGYTSDEIAKIKATIDAQMTSGRPENMAISEYVDMCTTLANV